jgi:hypothetical protein
MSGIVVAPGLVVSPGIDGLNANSPIIGYQSLVTSGNVTATTTQQGAPASHLANPSTVLKWRASSAITDQVLTVTLETADDLDYVSIAGHNFGSGQMPVSVEGLTGSPPVWGALVPATLLANDGPVIFRFPPQPLAAIRVRIQPSGVLPPAAPVAAVLYAGKLLVLQRRIYVGHTPMPYGRKLTVANHRSIAGAFLGRIVLSEKTTTGIDLQNLTPAWYRSQFEPFLIAAKEIPFFFGWRPGSYPHEVGFAWLTNDPQPKNQRANGMMQVSLDLEGIVQ